MSGCGAKDVTARQMESEPSCETLLLVSGSYPHVVWGAGVPRAVSCRVPFAHAEVLEPKEKECHVLTSAQQKPDVDNLLKALQDSLCGKCDAHVWDARGIKVWDTSGFIEIFEIGDDPWDFWIR